ncbi:unnamed protein product, partial [Laminaria digitata]
KQGANQGRQFYACPRPQGEQCGHFDWADEERQGPGSGGGGSGNNRQGGGRGRGRGGRGGGGGLF